MAIAAAHAEDPWSFASHGLRPDNLQGAVGDITVRPDGDGAFQRVANATGSPVIAEPISLGALWSSLPDLANVGTFSGGDWPAPLDLNSWEWMAGNPQATLYLRREDMPADQAAWRTVFHEMMTTYPAADGWAIPAEADAIKVEDTPWSSRLGSRCPT